MAMRLDFDFKGIAGYVIARKKIDLPLPDDYAFSFYIRGEAPENNLELKLIDASGQNVWWASQRHFEFSSQWQQDHDQETPHRVRLGAGQERAASRSPRSSSRSPPAAAARARSGSTSCLSPSATSGPTI